MTLRTSTTVTAKPGNNSRVAVVRQFNRFYTRQIGVLNEAFLGSPYSLTEGRVLYELAQREKSTATAVRSNLGLDPGYLSRILRAFKSSRLIRAERSQSDGRETFLSLTPRGRKAIATLNARSNKEVAAKLRSIPEFEKRRLVTAMNTIEDVLAPPSGAEPGAKQKEPYILRPHQVGDMGWIVHRQGALYAQEYHWDEQYEALVAEIVAKFIQNFDPRRERCWIAERQGQIVGSVFLVKYSNAVAKLRLLYVEPSARGLGIGGRLVAECIRFARQAGYKKISLWTQSNLRAARHIYKAHGFRRGAKKRHHSFGHHLIAETWNLKL
ncbi:MAG: helix-turn-helix domain-containing GNAT family N-acetyltransferase [Candidatus Acidiferrales bacterium]